MNLGFHVVNALVPLADRFDTAADTDVIDAGGGNGVLFVIQQGANVGGISTVTVEACSNTTPSATTTIPFMYRSCVTGDTWGAWTGVAATGFSTSAVANTMHQIWVDPSEIAEAGYRYVRLSTDETTNAAVTAGVLAIVFNERYSVSPSLID